MRRGNDEQRPGAAAPAAADLLGPGPGDEHAPAPAAAASRAMSDEARSADTASAGRFINPVAEDDDGEEEAAAGSGPAPSAAETPFFCKVLRVLLRVAGVHSLWHWRIVHAMLMAHVATFALTTVGTSKYLDNSADPQRPFLAPM